MSDNSFTPGPWKIHLWRSRGGSGLIYEGQENGVDVYSAADIDRHFQIVADQQHLGTSRTFGSFEGCHIAKLDIVYDSAGETAAFDEALANARLIHAAPDLLAALQAPCQYHHLPLINVLGGCHSIHIDGAETLVNCPLSEEARAAIAKTRGDEQA